MCVWGGGGGLLGPELLQFRLRFAQSVRAPLTRVMARIAVSSIDIEGDKRTCCVRS